MTTALRLALIIPVLLLSVSTASARRNKDKGEIAELVQQVKKDWQAKDSTFNKTLKKAYAYAIFPEVGKGGFIVGATISPDIARFSRRPSDGPKAALLSFGLGFTLVLICAGLPSIVTGDKEITASLVNIGLGLPALLVIIFATWTTNISNLYSSSLALAKVFPHAQDWMITTLLGGAGIVLAMLGIMGHLTDFLALLGITIPPIAGIYLTDYFLRRPGSRSTETGHRLTINTRAFASWATGIAVALISSRHLVDLTGIPACDAIIAASTVYYLSSRNAIRETAVTDSRAGEE